MIRRLVALFLLASTLPFAPVDAARAAAQSQPPTVTLPDLVARIKPSVVTVLVYKGEGDEPVSQGTGWFLSPTEIVTNRHVLEAGTRADIRLATGERVRITGVLAETSDQDLVILAVDVKGSPPRPIPLASTEPSEGARVFTIGSPLGLDLTVSEGIVSAVRNIAPYGTIFQTTAASSPGSSGSPLMDMQGRVVGVVTLQYSRGQALNFAIAASAVRSLRKTKGDTPSKWLDSAVKLPADSAFYLGLIAYLQSDYAEAVRQFRKAAEKHASDPTLHFNLGNAYYELGRWKEAIDALKQGIRIKPDYADAHAKLGLAYCSLGRFKEGIDALKQAIRISPDDEVNHFILGIAYFGARRTQEEIDAYKQAIRIKPDFAEAHNNLGFAYRKLGRWERSIDAYKQAIHTKPGDADAHFGLGLTYLQMDNKGGAFDVYKVLKELDTELANELFTLIYP